MLVKKWLFTETNWVSLMCHQHNDNILEHRD